MVARDPHMSKAAKRTHGLANPVAKALRHPALSQRIVKSKVKYNRKRDNKEV